MSNLPHCENSVKSARRISHARQNGQLLVYNAANLHLLNGNLDYEKPTTPSRDPPDDSFFEHDEKSTCTSTLSEIQSQTNNIRHQNMIYNDDVANDIRNIKEMILASHSKSRDSNNFVIAEDILAKQESMNTKLIQDMVEKMSTLKGENSAQEARLTLQLETASGRIVMLEKTKEMLDEQVASLEQTNVTQGNRINDLHKDLLEKKDLVARLQTIIEALKQQNDVEKEELANECERYSELNENIQKELMGAKLDNEVLCQKIDTITLQLNEFNDTIIPALQDKLDKERIAVEQKQYSESDLRGQLNQRDIEVTTLKQTLHDLHERSEKEQQQLNELNHESSEYWNKLNSEMKEKELEIVRLTHEMIQLQEQLITEQHRNTTENKRLEELENKWNVERSKLTESLIEYENKYNAELQTNTDHQMSLSHAHSTINELVSSNEEIKLDLEQAKTQSCQLQIDLENARKTHEEELYKYENKLGHHEKERKQLEHERRLREVAEDKAKELERQLRETSEERDLARENISGFNEREAELFHRLRESDRIRREQHSRLMQLMGNIRVFVRVRPALPAELLLEEEAANNNVKRKRPEQDCDEFEDESTVFKFPGYYENSSNKNQHSSDDDITKNMIEVLAPWEERGGLKDRRKRHRFGFDHVFAPQHNQNDIWEATEPLVQSAIDGFNVTVFAYGQTGSGKTYTMLGDEENKGIIGRAVEKLFLAKHDIELMSCNETEVSISVELLEVYNEKVRDLLSSSNPKEVKVSSGEVIGNRIVSKITEEQVMKLLSLAQSRRCVKSTCSNSESSRSHMVFTVHFDVKMKDGIQRNGKLNICDLAGSERLNKSGAHHVGVSSVHELNSTLTTKLNFNTLFFVINTGNAFKGDSKH